MLVPKLRFKEFKSEWNKIKLSSIVAELNEKTNDINKYPLWSLTLEDGVTPKTERYERGFLVKKEDNFKIVHYNNFVYNPMNLRLGAIAYHREKIDISVSGYYNIFKIKNNCTIGFWDNYFKCPIMIKRYNNIATGSLVEKKRVHYSQFIELSVPIPSEEEQIKISNLLILLNKKIELQQRKIEALKMYKKGLINEIFLDIDDYDIIGNVIEFEQPNKYIVSNANYEHKKTNDNIPVLTANKAFILGYTNEKEGIYKKGECVIFDDFTMESKYVDFEFKIKSSAIKILTAKGNNDMYYLFEAINTKKLVSNEHKRHYISIVQHLEIPVADLNTQCYISNLLRRYNKKLSVENEKLKELRILKTGLLQNMFI